MGTVILARHGETSWNADGRAQGWAPTDLTERGRRQAEQLADHLADAYDVDDVVASDIRRTTETARIVGDVLDAPVEYDDAWREQDLGTLQGFLASTLEREFPEYAVAEAGRTSSKRTPESGESFEAMCERVLDAWRSVRRDADDGTTLVVAHGGSIRMVLGEVMGLSVEEGVEHLDQDNCAVNVVRVDDDGATLDVGTTPTTCGTEGSRRGSRRKDGSARSETVRRRDVDPTATAVSPSGRPSWTSPRGLRAP